MIKNIEWELNMWFFKSGKIYIYNLGYDSDEFLNTKTFIFIKNKIQINIISIIDFLIIKKN